MVELINWLAIWVRNFPRAYGETLSRLHREIAGMREKVPSSRETVTPLLGTGPQESAYRLPSPGAGRTVSLVDKGTGQPTLGGW